jgi:cytoskeletal protein RodZ
MSANLRQVGAELRQHRLAKGWSVEEIYQMTFIQPYIVNALESGDLRQLPEPFYIRAFLRKYAMALGLDGADLANRFVGA